MSKKIVSDPLSKMARGIAAGILFAVSAATAATGQAETARWGEVMPALRIQVDAQRNRVWVLNTDAVYVYDGRTRRLIRRVELPDWMVLPETYSCTPELLLAPSGAALVTSNVMPVIWEIDPASLAVRRNSLVLDADHNREGGFAKLAFVRGGRELRGVNALNGSAWRIDLASGKAFKLLTVKGTAC